VNAAAVAAAAGVALLVIALALSAVLVVVDSRRHRLPNRLVLPLYPIGLAYAATRSLQEGSLAPALGAVVAAVVLFAGYGVLHVAGGGLGGGDVKLAGALGLLTGAHGWEAPVLATALAFLGGGVLALALIAARRADRRTRIAFGPVMLAGAWIALAADVL